MNFDETRLKEIQEYKKFYQIKLQEENTDLAQDLIQSRINKLDDEEMEILKRCDVI